MDESVRNIGLTEAIRQFERYQESGWIKSEVPNTACLIRAIGALRTEAEEVKRLRAVLSDIYPAIAGYAGALDYAGETVAFAEWQKVARKIYEVLEVRNG